MKVKILFFVFVMQVMINSGVYAADNIGDVRDSVKRGWSDVAWGKHIKHADYAALAACMQLLQQVQYV